jgi:hypothetical protein
MRIETIHRERAAHVTAMFERWAAGDLSDEPQWDIDQVERLRLGSSRVWPAGGWVSTWLTTSTGMRSSGGRTLR